VSRGCNPGACSTATPGPNECAVYPYRLKATNSAGTAYGADQTFTTPATRYAAWATAKFGGAGVPGSGPAEDPDKDGLINLLEYAFNDEPLTAGIPGNFPSAAGIATPGARSMWITPSIPTRRTCSTFRRRGMISSLSVLMASVCNCCRTISTAPQRRPLHASSACVWCCCLNNGTGGGFAKMELTVADIRGNKCQGKQVPGPLETPRMFLSRVHPAPWCARQPPDLRAQMPDGRLRTRH
jgi:hypothetical protein